MSFRLGYLVPEFPGQTHVFFWREVQALRSSGQQVSFISTRRPADSACRHEFAPAARAETHYVFPPGPASVAKWIGSACRGLSGAATYLGSLEQSGLKNRVRQLALLASAADLVDWARERRIDHVHAHSCADAAHVLALARHIGGPSYSLTLHGDLGVYGGDHRLKMAGAAFVCVVGNHLRRQVIEQVGLSPERILVTFMGVDTSKLSQLGQSRSFTPGALHIATVARLHPAKGHMHALAAVHRGRQAGLDLHYTVAGEGPYGDDLIERVGALGLQKHVTFTGTLAEKEVSQLLSRVDAFLLPSTGVGEAWPVSVMEAMAAGLPVIASVIGATPEMITPEEDGYLVSQGDEKALLEKISLIATNVEIRKRIGEAARQTASRRFDVATTAEVLHQAIQTRR
jgi:glycosyltransferase involved in cell wall biosynthesis